MRKRHRELHRKTLWKIIVFPSSRKIIYNPCRKYAKNQGKDGKTIMITHRFVTFPSPDIL